MTTNSPTRRHFILSSLAAGAAVALSSQTEVRAETKPAVQAAGPLPSIEGRKVLVVRGGYLPHDPVPCTDLFVAWMKSLGSEVIVSDKLDVYADKALMSSLDLIVQSWTMASLTPEQEAGLLGAVKAGCGLAGWHGGLCDSFRSNTGYWYMTGGQWAAHPGGIIDYSVQVTDHEDPVTAGLSDFAMHSEQYFMLIDPNSKVLATTTFSGEHDAWIKGCVMPVVWKKYFGQGRVFYSSLAHNLKDFSVPEVLEIMKRGILWASASRHAPVEAWVRPAYQGKA